MTFDEAWEHRVDEVLGGDIPAHFISREHLIQNKLAVGRFQDLADVEKIRERLNWIKNRKSDRDPGYHRSADPKPWARSR